MIALEKETAKGIWVNRDVTEVHADLEVALKDAGLWESLDYFDMTSSIKQKKIKRFPDFRWIACFPVSEPGQGHYIHVEAITASKKSRLIFIGKTVRSFETAATVANKCAELLGGPRRSAGRTASSRKGKTAQQHRRLSIRLPSDLVEALEKLGGTRVQHIEKAVRAYLEKTTPDAVR